VVALGAVRRAPYSKSGDPAGAMQGEDSLKVRPLVVDGSVKEWTTGDTHDVTDRSFVVRRVLRINDELLGEKTGAGNHWVWQCGPWLMVDRVNGHVTALKLPDYDPGMSQVSWFCDYAVLRRDGERQEPIRGCCTACGAKAGSCQETRGLRARRFRRDGLRAR
jgi:hypothetical protein